MSTPKSAASLLIKALITGITITLLASLALTIGLHRQAGSAEKRRSRQLLHSIISEVIRTPIEMSDYGEVRKLLTRIETSGFEVGIFIPPQDIIVADDQAAPLIMEALNKIGGAQCLASNSVNISGGWSHGEVACSRVRPSREKERPTPSSVMADAAIITIATANQTDDTTRFMVLFGATVLLIGTLTVTIDRSIRKHLVQPLRLLADLVSSDHLQLSKDTHPIDKTDTMPAELKDVLKAHENLLIRLKKEMSARESLSKAVARTELATQIAHDIRSPLAALEVAYRSTTEISEDLRILVRQASSRIRDIANLLLAETTKNQTAKSPANEPTMLSALADYLISEKRAQFKDRPEVEIRFDATSTAYAAFSKVNKTEICRVLSNLINNSVEAVGTSGFIQLTILEQDLYNIIRIQDNGPGMPIDIQQKIGKAGVTSEEGKASGTKSTGLGLYHAVRTAKEHGGRIQVQSSQFSGTQVDLYLPKCQAPTWFVDSLKIGGGSRFIIVDDDPTVHEIWRRRLGTDALSFYSASEFISWLEREDEVVKDLYLVDHDLGQHSPNGLDLIQQLKIANSAVLVTSRYDDEKIVSCCLKTGLRLLPKNMAINVPITTAS